VTPSDYRETLKRLNLTHEEAARLLGIHPVTSRKGRLSGPALVALVIIEHMGVDAARAALAARLGGEGRLWATD
jgi:hypothetical protein